MKLALALLLSACTVSAQELSLAVKSGDWAFALKLPASGSSKKEVVSRDGSARRTVMFNSNLTGSHLEYQIEVSRPDRKDPFQLQSAVDLPLGEPVELARCGGVSIGVNVPGAPSKTIPDNVLTKIEAEFGKDSGDCWVLVAPGSQANFSGSMLIGKNRKRLIFNEGGHGLAWRVEPRVSAPDRRPEVAGLDDARREQKSPDRQQGRPLGLAQSLAAKVRRAAPLGYCHGFFCGGTWSRPSARAFFHSERIFSRSQPVSCASSSTALDSLSGSSFERYFLPSSQAGLPSQRWRST